MPHYFFDTDDGAGLVRDEDGLELSDNERARNEGARGLAEMAREAINRGLPKIVTMWIRGENETALLRLTMHFEIRALGS